MRYLLAWLVQLLVVSTALAAAPLRLGNSPSHHLTGHMETMLDPNGSMTPGEAMSASFEPLSGEICYGFTKAAVWVRFSLARTTADPAEWWLEIDQPVLDDIRLYVPEGGGYVERVAGADRPESVREIDYRNAVFRLRLDEPGVRTYYLRLQTRNSMSVRLVAWQPIPFVEAILLEGRAFGVFFGAYCLVVIFYFAFWRWSREPVHGWYAVYVASLMLLAGFSGGWIQQLLPPLPPGLGDKLLGTSLCLVPIVTAQFVVRLLDSRRIMPRATLYFVTIASLVGGSGILAVLAGQYVIGMPLVQIAMGILIVMVTSIASLLAYRNHRQARLFLFAFSFFYLGGAIRLLRNFGILAPGFWTDNGYQIGSFIHMVVMSLGIFAGYNRLKREKAEAEARASAEHAAREEQHGFLSMVSHEFRTPLSVIDATIQNLAKHPADADTSARYDKIRRASDRLAALMDNYLSAERISSNEYKLNLQSVDLTVLVRDTANELTAAGPPVRVHAPTSLARRCDPDLLRIAIRNLIDNARRHSPGDRAVEVDLAQSLNRIEITVTDHGEGIPADELPRVFERFFRGRNTQHRPGTGLGLHLVQTIARRHGGRATVTSQLGHGARFRITIPSQGPSDVEQPCTLEPTVPRGG